ncbi:hypothetical protein ANN_18579 [Periplaneta americana]|uniref:Uncharacterized protein n=1 Tax=Periplaneta americana TaxID=6978 RepID=A0ABQ8SP56_PERAM|nr:hypothetical protein ANN_18579 [Periplaneta americana]
MCKHVNTWEWRESSSATAATATAAGTTTTTTTPAATTATPAPTTFSQQQQQPPTSLQGNQHCATYLFPSSIQATSMAAKSGDSGGALSNKAITSHSASILKGHARSASHGGVGASLTSASSVGVIGRPSALKQNRGHQRAFSQGQIVDGAGSTLRGHSRVGSRTDFILPPGHKEADSTTAGSGSATKPGGRGDIRGKLLAIKDLFEDRRRHASDKRINNSTCRVYKRTKSEVQNIDTRFEVSRFLSRVGVAPALENINSNIKTVVDKPPVCLTFAYCILNLVLHIKQFEFEFQFS